MKKILKFSALICAVVMSFSIGFTTAFAASRTTTILEDSFSNASFKGSVDDGKWQATFTTATKTIMQKDIVENPALRYIKGQSGGEWIQYGTKQKLANITSVEYSYMIPENIKQQGTWLGISFVGRLDPTKAGYYLYDAPLMLDHTLKIDGQPTQGKWVSVKIVPVSDTQIDIWLALRNEDGTAEFKTEKSLSKTGFSFNSINSDKSLTDDEKAVLTAEKIAEEGWSFKNAYVMWGCEGEGEGICLDDIKITTKDGDNDPVVYSTGFESLDLDSQSSPFKAYECGRAAKAALEVAEDNKMLFKQTNKGDRIVSYAKIVKDTSVASFVKCVDLSFNVKMSDSSSDAIALALGLANENADPTENGCLYIVEVDSVSGDAKGRFVEYKDGQIVNEQTTGHLLEKVTTKDGAKIAIEIYKSGETIVKHNGAVVSEDFVIGNYAGNLGFYSPKNNDGTVQIDNIFVDNSTYYVPTTKSVTHNFENSFFGNAGFEDFYKNATGGTMEVENGQLVWSSCSDYSYFGSAYEYDGFILDYQINSIFVTDKEDLATGATLPNRWIGLDIGRERKTQAHYGSYLTILFNINPITDDKVYPGIYIDSSKSPLTQADVTQVRYQAIPASLFRDIHYDNVSRSEADVKPEDTLCIRWVSDPKTESIKLYMKKLGEADFTLYYEAFVNATGYVALTCTGFVSFKMDNFSMSNTSPIYTIANNEVPETIYPEPEKEYIYTKPDVDVNLNEELILNAKINLGWILVVGSVVLALGGGACLVLGVLMLKKTKKPTVVACETASEDKENGDNL